MDIVNTPYMHDGFKLSPLLNALVPHSAGGTVPLTLFTFEILITTNYFDLSLRKSMASLLYLPQNTTE